MIQKSNSVSYLKKIDLINLKKQLELIMEHEKFYCDEDLNLTKLSNALEISTHQLSEFLNEHYNKNFNNYINGYRIRDAKILLIEDPQRNTLSIAYMVGFNSYTAFFLAFKKDTGISPADYRRKKIKTN